MGIAVLGAFLLGFAAVYWWLPRIIARCLLRIWPAIPAWGFVLFFTLIIITLLGFGTWAIFMGLKADEAREFALTGENDIGVAYGGLSMMIVIADLIGLPVSIWSGLSVGRSRLRETRGISE